MANFGQMLAAAQAHAVPQKERAMAQSQSQQKEFEVKKEKKSQMEELQALMEAEMKRASKKGGFFKNLGSLSKVLSFIPGVGSLASALMGSIAGAGQASAQKNALKKLMKDPRFAKYKGTWLSDPTKSFMKDVKGLAGDIDPLKTGLSSLATSMVTGKMAKGIGEKVKGAFSPETAVSGVKGGQSLVDTGIPGSMDKSFSLDDRLSGKVGGGVKINLGDLTKPDLLAGLDKSALGSRIAGSTIEATPLKTLFGGDKDWLMDIIGKAGEGTENLQALPLLLQMFGEDKGENYDAGSLFGG